MKYYVGLDVSLQETFVTIINSNREIISEESVLTEVRDIVDHLKSFNLNYDKIGIESGQLSIYLCKGLTGAGLNAICVDARHMSRLLSAKKVNKNDRNDALGIAEMMMANLYKEVTIKSDQSCEIKILLGGRRKLVGARLEIIATIRGLLKMHGIKIKPRMIFNQESIIDNLLKEQGDGNPVIKATIKSLIDSLKQIESSLFNLDQKAIKISKSDPDCKLLTTIPGVGPITALTYKSTIDEITRFKNSNLVGSYMGLTPKQYSSGEIDRHGSISKMGPKECRTMLYEAAQSLLIKSKKKSKLKSWGLKLQKKKGSKKAITAVARKLAVIMHQMLISSKEFCY